MPVSATASCTGGVLFEVLPDQLDAVGELVHVDLLVLRVRAVIGQHCLRCFVFSKREACWQSGLPNAREIRKEGSRTDAPRQP